ncbi:hypothetical protein S83_051980, partial [Arachis hypogaea]
TSNQWNNNTDAVACLNPPSQDSFVYGIYQNVEPLVTETNVINKYIYSLFWRFQQISTLAVCHYRIWTLAFFYSHCSHTEFSSSSWIE